MTKRPLSELGDASRGSIVVAVGGRGATLRQHRKPQKWREMAKLNRRRRWRGPAQGGRLQRGVRFCFSAHDGEATTPTLTEWARPEIVHAGRRPTATQMVNQARALRSIGAKKVRRAGNGWVWRLSDNEAE
jgi:hypothetical protein